MTRRELHLETAKGGLYLVQSMDYMNQIKAIGINDQEWKQLTGGAPWKGKERPVIERLIKHLIFGMLDLQGLPRFEVPAELIAGIGITFIRANNWWAFASWVGGFADATQLGNYDGSRVGSIEGLEKCTPSQIFALMLELNSNEHIDQLTRRFREKTGMAIESTLEQPEDETKK